jgi:hypothetical protein
LLENVKSDSFYINTMLRWHQRYRSADFLQSVSLGELGARIEFTIHNLMHLRWCRELDTRPEPTEPGPHAPIDPKWDDVSYDWLGDTYSSHVHPYFWRLHGWVDDCIGAWMDANQLADPVPWKGTWVGSMPPHPAPTSLHAMLSSAHSLVAPAMLKHNHDHDHGSSMEKLAALVHASGQVCHFYDLVEVPPL